MSLVHHEMAYAVAIERQDEARVQRLAAMQRRKRPVRSALSRWLDIARRGRRSQGRRLSGVAVLAVAEGG